MASYADVNPSCGDPFRLRRSLPAGFLTSRSSVINVTFIIITGNCVFFVSDISGGEEERKSPFRLPAGPSAFLKGAAGSAAPFPESRDVLPCRRVRHDGGDNARFSLLAGSGGTDCDGAGADDPFQMGRRPCRRRGLAGDHGGRLGRVRCRHAASGLCPGQGGAADPVCALYRLDGAGPVFRDRGDGRHQHHWRGDSPSQPRQALAVADSGLGLFDISAGGGGIRRSHRRGGALAAGARLFACHCRDCSGDRAFLVGDVRQYGHILRGADGGDRAARRISDLLVGDSAGRFRLSLRRGIAACLWRFCRHQAYIDAVADLRRCHGRGAVRPGCRRYLDAGRFFRRSGRSGRGGAAGPPLPAQGTGCTGAGTARNRNAAGMGGGGLYRLHPHRFGHHLRSRAESGVGSGETGPRFSGGFNRLGLDGAGGAGEGHQPVRSSRRPIALHRFSPICSIASKAITNPAPCGALRYARQEAACRPVWAWCPWLPLPWSWTMPA